MRRPAKSRISGVLFLLRLLSRQLSTFYAMHQVTANAASSAMKPMTGQCKSLDR
jgi:hypothetical protein